MHRAQASSRGRVVAGPRRQALLLLFIALLPLIQAFPTTTSTSNNDDYISRQLANPASSLCSASCNQDKGCCLMEHCVSSPFICSVVNFTTKIPLFLASLTNEFVNINGAADNATCSASKECASNCCATGKCQPASAPVCANPTRGRLGGIGTACLSSNTNQCASGCCIDYKCANATACATAGGVNQGLASKITVATQTVVATTSKRTTTTTATTTTTTRTTTTTTTTVAPAPAPAPPPPPPPPSPPSQSGPYIPSEYLDPNYNPMGLRLIDQDNWCLLFPTDTSKPIGETEQYASIKCSPSMVSRSGGKLPALNSGVIVTTHFSTGSSEDGQDTWVQMGGGFNGDAYPLHPGDSGGQYDSSGVADPARPDLLGSPRGSSCLGYDRYVELLGPWYRNYCVRCCKGPNADNYCNWRLSGEACGTVFPGIQMEPLGI